MATIKTDLICNLNQPVNVTYLHGNLFSQDNAGNTINVFVMDNGEPATIGGTVSANVIRSDGQTVAVSGAIEGNKAYVILPQACYAVPGVVHIIIKLTQNTTITTIAAIVANVYMSTTDAVIDPGTVIPSIQALIALIEEAVDSIPTDYTGLLHTIAADYSSSKTYKVGDYAWESGVLKRCIVPITAAETYTAAHWTNAVIGDDLTNLKSAFDRVEDICIDFETVNVTYTSGGLGNGFAPNSDNKRIRLVGNAMPVLSTGDYIDIGAPFEGKIYASNTNAYGSNVIAEITNGNWTQGQISIPEQYSGKYFGILLRDKSNPTSDISSMVNTVPQYVKIYHVANTIDRKLFTFNGTVSDLGYTALTSCRTDGWYRCGTAYYSSIDDLPTNIASGGFLLNVYNKAFGYSNTEYYIYQELHDNTGAAWRRVLSVKNGTTVTVAKDWIQIAGIENYFDDLNGKVVAVIGDSISTLENENAVEITVTAEDVGVQLSATLTYNDVNLKNLSLGGHTFTSSEIGTEVTFTPLEEDIGKTIGWARNYNPSSVKVWWKYLEEKFYCTVIPVCWSGSSITSHRKNVSRFENSYAWHISQIRKCGIRTPGTMDRTAPDVIIIARGGNDFHHTPYAKITSGYFDNPTWTYPEDDTVENGYGILEGYAKTVQMLRTAYPNAQIMFCTCPIIRPSDIDSDQFVVNNGTNSLQQFNKATREAADFFGCGIINFDKDGITFENAYSGGFITDDATNPVHPNNLGHAVMAKRAIRDIMNQYNELG